MVSVSTLLSSYHIVSFKQCSECSIRRRINYTHHKKNQSIRNENSIRIIHQYTIQRWWTKSILNHVFNPCYLNLPSLNIIPYTHIQIGNNSHNNPSVVSWICLRITFYQLYMHPCGFSYIFYHKTNPIHGCNKMNKSILYSLMNVCCMHTILWIYKMFTLSNMTAYMWKDCSGR